MNRHSKSIIAIALSLVLLLNAYAAIAYTFSRAVQLLG